VNLTRQDDFLLATGVQRPTLSFTASGVRAETDIMIGHYPPGEAFYSQWALHNCLQSGLSNPDGNGWPRLESQRMERSR
jgi:hypothetical protein